MRSDLCSTSRHRSWIIEEHSSQAHCTASIDAIHRSTSPNLFLANILLSPLSHLPLPRIPILLEILVTPLPLSIIRRNRASQDPSRPGHIQRSPELSNSSNRPLLLHQGVLCERLHNREVKAAQFARPLEIVFVVCGVVWRGATYGCDKLADAGVGFVVADSVAFSGRGKSVGGEVDGSHG